MVGEDHEQVARRDRRQCIAHQPIDAGIEVVDDVAEPGRLVGHPARVALVAVAPEHMLQQVGGAEVKEQAAARELG